MLLDKLTLLCDAMAYDGTPEELNFGADYPCKSDPFTVFISGEGDVAGNTVVTLLTGTVAATIATTIATVTFTAADMNAGKCSFQIPANCRQYFTISLATLTAGTINSGIVMNAQSNF